jgi:hypothetical protein
MTTETAMTTPASPPISPSPLDPSAILVAEFNYVAQAAFQANEDRARVSSYYLVSVGAVIGAVFGARLDGVAVVPINLVFGVLFGVLSFIGLTTLLQLARLRAAWEDAAVAMNMIKRFYATSPAGAELEAAFFWKSASLPAGRSRRTVSFLLAASVMLISSVMAVVALGFWLIELGAGPSALEAAIRGRLGFTGVAGAAGGPASANAVIVASVLACGLAAVIGGGEYHLYWSWIEDARKRRRRNVADHFVVHPPATAELVDRLRRMRPGIVDDSAEKR